MHDKPAMKQPTGLAEAIKNTAGSAQANLPQIQREKLVESRSSQHQDPLLAKRKTGGADKPKRPPLKRAFGEEVCRDDANSPVEEVIDLESDKENAKEDNAPVNRTPSRVDPKLLSTAATVRIRPRHMCSSLELQTLKSMSLSTRKYSFHCQVAALEVQDGQEFASKELCKIPLTGNQVNFAEK